MIRSIGLGNREQPRTVTQYVIVTKAPGERAFKFRPFTGASPREDEAREALRHQRAIAAPGWEFRLQKRTVTTSYGPWEAVE